MNKLNNIIVRFVIAVFMIAGLIFAYNSISFILGELKIIETSKILHNQGGIFGIIIFFGSFFGLLIEGLLFLKVFLFKYHRFFGYFFLIMWILSCIGLVYDLYSTYSI